MASGLREAPSALLPTLARSSLDQYLVDDFDLHQSHPKSVHGSRAVSRRRSMLMRRHHFLALALIILAVLIAAITFKARKAAGQPESALPSITAEFTVRI
jgi:hypothetical protein